VAELAMVRCAAIEVSMLSSSQQPVLVTGATGFVGSHLLPALARAGTTAVGATRDPVRAAARWPSWRWVELDLERPQTLVPALTGCRAAVFLVHAMAGGGDYHRREQAAAQAFATAAAQAALERIVYLGGVAPHGTPSRHLASRLATGETLRNGTVPTIELRAGMIIGSGSTSWQIVRDLALRLPGMILPAWLHTRSQPVAIDDVCAAIVYALNQAPACSAVENLPGPEIMSAREILLRIAALHGRQPLTIDVPLLTPRLSSLWIQLVTRADHGIAAELVEGLTNDLTVPEPGYWRWLPEYQRTPFDSAARQALTQDAMRLSPSAQWLERVARAITPRLSPLAGNAALAVGCVATLALAAIQLAGQALPSWLAIALFCIPGLALTVVFDAARWKDLVRPNWRAAFGGLLLGTLLSGLTHLLYPSLVEHWPALGPDVAVLYARLAEPPGVLVLAPWIALVVVLEELIWRGSLLDRMTVLAGSTLGSLATVMLYTLTAAASGSPALTLAALVGGTIWTLERQWTGSIAACVATHLMWNGIVMIGWPLQ
jgi:uncharacterized protein YbjT (DUF2867 family)/membrane protease YdiL (CAAX protease family)